MRWTIFCRVVDNFGDIGFAWRLAADLAGRGEQVRLAIDDPSALAWMAPRGAPRLEVVEWQAAASGSAEVLLETFGCGFLAALEDRLASASAMPVCINVEHLSAEPYVERSHGLASARSLANGKQLTTWFCYPGFSERTGGLLREPGLAEQRRRFGDGREWLASRGVERRSGERCVSLFCYDNPAFDGLLDALAAAPTVLLLAPGQAADQAAALLGPRMQRDRLRAVCLPRLEQPEFDRLLWSCDLNFVRGEDSLVRAIWAGAPFVWQLYPQHDGAHAAKLAAFLELFLARAPIDVAASLRCVFAAWNGFDRNAAPLDGKPWPAPDAWAGHCVRWRDRLAAQPDLTSQLLVLAASKR